MESDATVYPNDMAAPMAQMLSQQIEEGILEVKNVVVFHEEDKNLYAIQITYKRTQG